MVLFAQERYLEPALAYQVVVDEFPKHLFAPDAARYATAALRRASKQLRSPPGGTLVKSERVWEVKVSHLRLKLACQRWAEVASEIRMFGKLGSLKTAPARIKAELRRLEAQAKKRL